MRYFLFSVTFLLTVFSVHSQSNSSNVNVTVNEKKSSVEILNESRAAKAAVAAAMAPASINVAVPIEKKLDNYTHMALVSCQTSTGKRTKASYDFNEESLLAGPWTVLNPFLEDKRRAKVDPMFLRSERNSNWLYWYYSISTVGVDAVREVTVRDSQNNVLYRATATNVEAYQFVNEFLSKAW